MLTIGDKKTVTTVVNDSNTAKAMVSGALDVFATPCMIALMERAGSEYIDENIESHLSSVGTMVNITHLMATPKGMEVQATAEVTAIDGKKIDFKVTAETDFGVIGEGLHTRFIIDKEKFMHKTNSQLNNK